MNLNSKQLYKLQKHLAELINDKDKIRAICTQSGLNPIKIDLDGSVFGAWANVLAKVLDDQEELAKLLKTVMIANNTREINNFYNEITVNIDNRINLLADAIKKKKCLLFLGPDILKVSTPDNSFISFNHYICQLLEKSLADNMIYYAPDLKDNLNYMAQCYAEIPNYTFGDVSRLAEKNYQEKLSTGSIDLSIHKKLLQLPFKLVINANPDHEFYNELNKFQKNSCLQLNYDISNNPDKSDPEIPEDEKQTIHYNLFGTFDVPNSILYTESQFLDFIKRIIQGNPRLNNRVSNLIKECDTYLYLGFDFDQWYFKVMFELFQIKKQNDSSVSCNNLKKLSSLNKEFYEEEFKVYFVQEHIDNFLTQLINKVNA